MIGYVTLGTNDLERAAKFYDELLAVIGAGRFMEEETFVVDSPEKVHALHAKAMELGGANEGDPGPRSGPFYAGYFRDLDGNKLNAFCIVEGQA